LAILFRNQEDLTPPGSTSNIQIILFAMSYINYTQIMAIMTVD